MKIYLAATYSRHPEMREVRDRLAELGHIVTSRWIDQHADDHTAEKAMTPEELKTNTALGCHYANKDLADIVSAHALIMFSAGDGQPPGRGGRHIEFGYAYALHKRIFVVGPRESVFHCLPGVAVMRDIDELLGYLASESR